MKTHSRSPADSPSGISTGNLRDAESIFRSKPINEIRAIEATTRRAIEQKKEELRQLVGKSYRDLIDSADSIIQMKTSCESISSNLSLIDAALRSLSPSATDLIHIAREPARAKIYGIACRVKYLVDTSENIWGCLDESMLLEASGRYLRAKEVHGLISTSVADPDFLARFPLLQHQWQIVESFTSQISQRSRDRLMDRDLTVEAYADALVAAATIDDLNPAQVLGIYLESRRAWISQKAISATEGSSNSTTTVLCDVAKVIRSSLGQVGQLFCHALNETPLFYKMVLGSPPGSQLFGGIPNPEEEVKLWKSHREKLELMMGFLEPDFISQKCSSWLQSCCNEIFAESSNGKGIIDAISCGEEVAAAELLVRQALDGEEGLEESLKEWLRCVFGSDIKSPWKKIYGLILKRNKDILEDKMEDAFLLRMKEIVQSGFKDLSKEINLRQSVDTIVLDSNDVTYFNENLKKSSKGGGVWFLELNQKRAGITQNFNFKSAADENDFQRCLSAYFGLEVCRIRDIIDKRLCRILDDLLCFVESHNVAMRLKEMAPYIQDKCYIAISTLLGEIQEEIYNLSETLFNNKMDNESQLSYIIVERSLFIGRLLYALHNHSSQIPLILGSPKQWAKGTTDSAQALVSPLFKLYKESIISPLSLTSQRHIFDSPLSPGIHSYEGSRRQALSAATALFTYENTPNLKHEELRRKMQDLYVRSHILWVTWVSNELSIILSDGLNRDDALSSTNPVRGWEVTVIKQGEPAASYLEMQIVLPSMASQYIISFLFQACQEIHRVGGHVIDKAILQNLAYEMLKKVVGVYEIFLAAMDAPESNVSEKGVLQIILDLRFCADVLSGGKDTDSIRVEVPPLRRKPLLLPGNSLTEALSMLVSKFSQRLDPIDWATYEPYLWENERQSYKRCSVLFGFFIQLNRLYADTVQKLPTKSNTESNILRCSAVPRFKYLPISAPSLASRGAHKPVLQISTDDSSLKGLWKTYSNGDRSPKPAFDDSSSFGVAAPLLKSLMTQVGSKFGESTSRWGLMLSDGPAGLLSSFSSGASRFDSL